MAALKEKYRKEIVPKMMEVQGYKNIMEVPKLEKVVVGIGLGEAVSDAKALEGAQKDLPIITGQKTDCYPLQEVHCQLQVKRRDAHRIKGHVTPGEDV